MNQRLLEGDLTGRIANAFYSTYDGLGFGFLESVYRNALTNKLRDRGFHAVQEYPIDVWFEGRLVGRYRADIVVNDVSCSR